MDFNSFCDHVNSALLYCFSGATSRVFAAETCTCYRSKNLPNSSGITLVFQPVLCLRGSCPVIHKHAGRQRGMYVHSGLSSLVLLIGIPWAVFDISDAVWLGKRWKGSNSHCVCMRDRERVCVCVCRLPDQQSCPTGSPVVGLLWWFVLEKWNITPLFLHFSPFF